MIEVTGQVVDATTGEGVPGATISVNGKAITAADGSGNFTLQVDTYNDTITASSVGYVSLMLPASQVQQSGLMRLGIDAESLAAVTVTPQKNDDWALWALAGVVIIGSSNESPSISGHGSSLIPIALLGLGGYFLLKSNTSLFPTSTPPMAPYAPVTSPTGGNSSILPSGGLSSLANLFTGLFGGSSTPSYAPVGVQPIPGTSSPSSPAANYPTIPTTPPSIPIAPGAYGDNYSDIEDYAWEVGLAGIPDHASRMGATTSINAGDIIGKTMIADMRVPLYDIPRDDAQPSGYVDKGNPIGIVYSYLSPDSSQGRAELWWMFEPMTGNSDVGNDQGFYFVPHNPDYFDTQALLDAGVLTVAQATALKNGTGPSTIETLIDKYLPWIIGAVAAIGIGKSVINKVI